MMEHLVKEVLHHFYMAKYNGIVKLTSNKCSYFYFSIEGIFGKLIKKIGGE